MKQLHYITFVAALAISIYTMDSEAWTKTHLPENSAEAATIGGTCRNPSQKHAFDVKMGYPHGRDGTKIKVDHICALENGGKDDPINMQYQDIDVAHEKDLIERTPEGRAKFCTSENSTPTRKVYNCKKVKSTDDQ